VNRTDHQRKAFVANLRRQMFEQQLNFKQLSDKTGVDHQLLRRWGSIGISRIDRRNYEQLVSVAAALGFANPDAMFHEAPSIRSASAADRATNPMIEEIRRERPELFDAFTTEDWEELYSIHGAGGALNREGVVHFAERINAKRDVRRKFEAVLETHHFRTLAAIIDVMYRDTDPRRAPGSE
jgi:hypothetical protein